MATQKELDSLFGEIDCLLYKRKFDRIEARMKRIDIEKTDIDILITYLQWTSCVKDQIPYRKQFLQKSIDITKKRGEYTEDLFTGLE